METAWEGDPPDLILLDIMMPGMDGYEVCEKLRANEQTEDIPVIFLTAKTEKDDIVKGFEAGEIIQGIAVAIKAGASKAVFDATVGIHPTTAEEFVTMREPVSG